MGLNMNYSLLTGRHVNKYQIPEYTNKECERIYSESAMIQSLIDFNQEIRDIKNMISEATDVSSENNVSKEIYNGFINSIQKTVDSVNKLKDAILNNLEDSTRRIQDIISKNDNDEIEKNYSVFDREMALKKVLSSESISISIVDINPSKDLLDNTFPDVSVLSDTTAYTGVADICRVERGTSNGYRMSSDIFEDKDSVNDFYRTLNDDRDRLLYTTFRDYDYEVTDIMGSAKRVAKEAFGENDHKDEKLTVMLYGLACDNIDKFKNSIVDDFDFYKQEYLREYNGVVKSISGLKEDIKQALNNPSSKYDSISVAYENIGNTISETLQRTLNVVNSVINANSTLFIYKIRRLTSLISSSYIVKNAAHRLIKKNIDNVKEDIPFNGHDQIKECLDIQNDFMESIMLINDAFMENNFDKELNAVLLEVGPGTETGSNSGTDGSVGSGQPDNTSGSATPNPLPKSGQQTKDKPNEEKQKKTKKSNNTKSEAAVKNWLQKLLDRVGEAFEKFKLRINELIIKDGPDKFFWNKHKENIKRLKLDDTQANDWYRFNLDAFKTIGTVQTFDITKDYMTSDDKFQNELFRVLTNGGKIPDFNKDDSFAQKINKIYQGGNIVSNSNTKGTMLKNLGYNHEAAWNFVNDMITNGFNGETLHSIGKGFNDLDNTRKSVNSKYSSYADQLNKLRGNKEEKANDENKQQENKQQNQVNNNPQQQNQGQQKSETEIAGDLERMTKESALIDSDFKFNLAEHFGLVYHEANFTMGSGTAKSASDIGLKTGGVINGSGGYNEELNNMITRFFNYNTIAITAKMTMALSAYKQFIGLYRYIIKDGKTADPNEDKNKKKK